MKYITGLALAAGLILSACGGGGDGSGIGDSANGRTLEVSDTFPRETLSLFQPAEVLAALAGFETLAPGLILDPASGIISGTLTTQGSITAPMAILPRPGHSNALSP